MEQHQPLCAADCADCVDGLACCGSRAGAASRGWSGPAPPPPPPPQGPPPFTHDQTAWLRNVVSDAVGASIGSFASHVSAEFVAVREDLATVKFEANEAAMAASHAKDVAQTATSTAGAASRDIEEMRNSIDALSARVEALRTSEPSDTRRVARIGLLGWDATPEVLEERAHTLLAEAGIARGAFGPVAAVTGRGGLGSAVETVFASRASLEQAKVAVRGLRRVFDGDRAAWLDEARTRAETRPVRIMHRVADVIQALEAARPDRMAVGKDPQARATTVGGRRAVFVGADKLVWTPLAINRYDAAARSDAEALATSS